MTSPTEFAPPRPPPPPFLTYGRRGEQPARKRVLPEPNYQTRGDRRKLMHSWTAEEADTARAELRKAYYAETSKGPQQSRRRTVSLLLKCTESSVCLTTGSLETLAAQLKGSGYRSGFKYLLEAKKMHISAGHDWCPQLEQMLCDCRRGIERGIGAAKKAAELRLHEISHLPDER